MKKNLIQILVLLSPLVMAEVKPAEEVLMSNCGMNSRSLQVCVANSEKNSYVTFRMNAGPTNYVHVEAKYLNPGITGASNILYTGYQVVANQDGKMMEQKFELQVTRVIVPGAKAKAVLSVNGKKKGESFEMETISHTESLGQ